MVDCPQVCNADLRQDVMSSYTALDLTNVIDRTCNELLFLTDDAGLNDVTDATSGAWLDNGTGRTQLLTSMDEVRMHYLPSSETFKAAAQYFRQVGERGLAPYFIVGFWDKAGGESAATALDLISECQACFCHVTAVHADTTGANLMDGADYAAIYNWADINGKIAYLDSIDVKNEDPSDATSFKGQMYALGLKDHWMHYVQKRCQKAIDPVTGEVLLFANGDPVVDYLGAAVLDDNGDPVISDGTVEMTEAVCDYHSFLAAGWIANVDLSQLNSGYDMAYKPQGGEGWIGIPAGNWTNAQVSNVTGTQIDGTLNTFNNGHANMYIRTGGGVGIFSGTTIGGRSIFKVHLDKWLRQQQQDAMANMFFRYRRLPFDNARGRALILNAFTAPMRLAQANGHFTNDPQNWEEGGYIRRGIGWVVRNVDFSAPSPTEKRDRKFPVLRGCYVCAGSGIFVPIELCVISDPTQLIGV